MWNTPVSSAGGVLKAMENALLEELRAGRLVVEHVGAPVDFGQVLCGADGEAARCLFRLQIHVGAFLEKSGGLWALLSHNAGASSAVRGYIAKESRRAFQSLIIGWR